MRGGSAPRAEVFLFNGTITADAAGLGLPTGDSAPQHLVRVRPGASGIHVALAWQGEATDLDAVLVAPGWCAGQPSLPVLGEVSPPCEAQKATRSSGGGWFQNGNGTPATPDSPSTLDVSSADIAAYGACNAPVCLWTAWAWVDSALAATYQLRVEVEYPAGAGAA